MFEPSESPRLFGCASGVDFPDAVIRGLEKRLQHAPPEAWARVTILVNTQRMARRMRDILDAGPARLLPRIHMLTDLDGLLPETPLPAAGSGLRRRLELATLVARLLEAQPELAARSASFDLADSLAALMDEMQSEGVTAKDIAALDVSDQSGHWARAQQFIAIAQSYIDAAPGAPDPEARQRETVLRLVPHWETAPPNDPILIAGSTASRGTTQLLMQAISRLPQGAALLPGFDFDMPDAVWNSMGDATTGEDHPQFRFLRLTRSLDVTPSAIRPWVDLAPPSPARNRLVSLALRPAPVTDAWRLEGPGLTDLESATRDITLIEADTPRAEALAIAMRLRMAAEDGQTAALITPDRMLTRQVTAALDRWDIRPDDSAGTPLQLSPPGRFLRHTAALLEKPLDAEALLTLLKHPLTHSGGGRNDHQLNTLQLELRIRRDGLPYPAPESLIACAQKSVKDYKKDVTDWARWVAGTMCDQVVTGTQPLSEWVARHLALSAALAAGHIADHESELWQKKAGQTARALMDDLAAQAKFGGTMSASDYAALIGAVLAQGEVRDRDEPHPNIKIWGTMEARVQGADLVILAGLNDGTWPEPPAPDPWLNRKMRHDAGLLLPERRIGLSAHDFQQAIAAREVWLTRAIRSDDAETVPSRWMNRLSNLMSGLGAQGGPQAWKAMQDRGAHWLALVRQLDAAPNVDKAKRPAPCPPVAARPKRLTVTEIKTLIRDPYAIYAKHVLRLRSLNPLVQTPDALLRGILSHDVMEGFVKETLTDPQALSVDGLMRHAIRILEDNVPWPAARILWLSRFGRAAQWIVDTEITRQSIATPHAFENKAKGRLDLSAVGMLLDGRADRIDVDDEGQVILYDYKTGQPPSKKQQAEFDKQLLIEAAMLEEGAFKALGPRTVRRAQFIGIGTNPKVEDAPLDEEPPAQVLRDLVSLLAIYMQADKGYTSRRALEKDTDAGNYDQLARFGEWDATDDAVPEVLT